MIAALVVICVAMAAACSGQSNDKSASTGAAVEAAPAAGGNIQPATPLAIDQPATRQQIRTAKIELSSSTTDDVERIAADAVGIATTAGGEVDTDRRSGGDTPTADLVLRVPPDQLDATVEQLAGLATVASRSIETEDVTATFTDLEGRIAALQISVERLRGFLAETKDAAQVATLESELTKRETDLEAMQGQLRGLGAKVDLATITLTVRTQKSIASATAPSPSKALDNGWSAFRLVVRWTVAIALAVLPFAVTAALIIWAVSAVNRWRARRRRGRLDASPPSPPPPGFPSPPVPPPPPSTPTPETAAV